MDWIVQSEWNRNGDKKPVRRPLQWSRGRGINNY